ALDDVLTHPRTPYTRAGRRTAGRHIAGRGSSAPRPAGRRSRLLPSSTSDAGGAGTEVAGEREERERGGTRPVMPHAVRFVGRLPRCPAPPLRLEPCQRLSVGQHGVPAPLLGGCLTGGDDVLHLPLDRIRQDAPRVVSESRPQEPP